MTSIIEIRVLPLDSPRWTELSHAYGDGSDIPDVLRQLETTPAAEGDQEPWLSIWSALAHQGDVYTASFAAVPHVVRALAASPLTADSNYFQFPALVESWRLEKQVSIPKDLETAYFAALGMLPGLVAQAAVRQWDEDFVACALAAVAASKGYGTVASTLLDMTPEVVEEFRVWLESR